jgi:hypothetical protein
MSEEKLIDLEQTDPNTFRLFQLLHSVFTSSPQGKELLDLLIKRYLYAPCAHQNAPEWFAYFRDGENNVIRSFMRSIEQFNQIQESKK